VVISADLPSGPKAQFVGFSSAKRTAAREIKASIYISDALWKTPKVQIDGLRCTELPGSKISYTPSENVDGSIGTMVWKEDVDMLEEEALRSFISSNYAVRRFSISRRSSITDSSVPSEGLQKVITQVSIRSLLVHKSSTHQTQPCLNAFDWLETGNESQEAFSSKLIPLS
jgi:hypothetical protein